MVSTLLTTLSALDLPPAYFLAPAGAVVALVMAFVFARSVRARPEGDAEMIRIAAAVRTGAMAYLKRQYNVVAGVFGVLAIVLALLTILRLQPALSMIGVPIAGFLSGLCGWIGMRMATDASARTAAAAKNSLNDGLTVAFRAGAVMGLNVVGFALLDISIWFFILTRFGEHIGVEPNLANITTIMLSFAMGASTQALFARVGGGIYTKAADVGADLVGKVEAGIPEDDARNPATIADNVGDNVGDVAGMGADLYESYYGSILSTLALGAAAAATMTMSSAAGGTVHDLRAEMAIKLAVAPLVLAGLGIICSVLGIFTVKARADATFAQLLKALHLGVYTASALIIAVTFGVMYFIFGRDGAAVSMLAEAGTSWVRLGGAIVVGLMAGNIIAYATEYYTSYERPPTRRIAEQALTGPATVIIAGIAEGMKSTWASLVVVVVAILAAFTLAGGSENFLLGLYGIGFAAVGMLSTLGITLATDAYGPIADNAGGNAEMTGQPPHVRERTDMLDSLGNTTAATGKGFAIGSAALTALALFAAYIQIIQIQINTQSATFIQNGAFTAPAGAPAFAVYEGHGKFALVFPNAGRNNTDLVAGGLLIDRDRVHEVGTDHGHEVDFEWGEMAVGQVFPVVAGDRDTLVASRRIMAEVSVGHGNHSHEYRFELVSASTGTVFDVLSFYDITLTNPRVLCGLFMGVLLVFLFCALTMNAVGRAAYAMMRECRRQFSMMREAFRQEGMSEADIAEPTRWPKAVVHEGITYPDYASCVSISTAGAQRAMVVPALLAIIVPVAVGMVLSVPGVMGLLAGGLTSGFAVAIFMANAGGAWDNAKKLIESYGRITADMLIADPSIREKLPVDIRDALVARAQEMRATGRGSAYVYGKGSDDHKATVVGDTVGDPFKDTSGPSLNILIKLISIVAVVFAGLTVKYGPIVGDFLGLN